MRFSILLILAISIFFSCSNPLDKAYNEDTFSSDLLEIKKNSPEDAEMVKGMVMLGSLSEGSMVGKSYGEILQSAKDFKAAMEKQQQEEKELAEKVKKEEAERITRLGAALTVTATDKGFATVRYQDYITMKFAFENKTEKGIKAFKGTVVFNDLFDEEIKRLTITYDEGIKAKSIVKWNGDVKYNEFRDSDSRLKSKDLDNMKIIWIPESIIFEDGTTLE